MVVSLTSIPERFAGLHLGLESLLRQSSPPDRLLLWVESKASLPRKVTKLTARGLEIRECKDIGPYCKFFYTLQELPDAVVVTADDDLFYPRHWLRDLLEGHGRHPRCIVAHRVHRMTLDPQGGLRPYEEWESDVPSAPTPSPLLFPTGCGGSLLPPGALDREVVFDEEVFRSICPTSDDVWIKAMALLNETLVVKAPGTFDLNRIPASQLRALKYENVAGGKNDEHIRNVLERYDLYRRLVPAAD